jgi:threonine/homoserine/homoserine lactone efflux protein
MASFLLTLGNPKAILFFLALLPTVVDLATLNLLSIVQISVAMCVVQPAVLIVYCVLAAKARALFTTPSAVKKLNRSSGAAMAGAAALIATR